MVRKQDVVEAEWIPKTYALVYGFLIAIGGGDYEPLAGRIVELEHDVTAFLTYDPNARIDVFVPRGSLDAGAALVASGGPTGTGCALCHGGGLKGTVVAPPLSGRSPGYIARQLNDFKTRHRNDPGARPMQLIASTLTDRQITQIAAYLAKLPR